MLAVKELRQTHDKMAMCLLSNFVTMSDAESCRTSGSMPSELSMLAAIQQQP